MFKKPSKRTFRKKLSGHESDEEAGNKKDSLSKTTVNPHAVEEEDEEESPYSIPLPRKSPVDGLSHSGPATKLSFNDDSGDTEEFRIKKSTRSRRIVKQLKEEWQENTGKTEAQMKELRIGNQSGNKTRPGQSQFTEPDEPVVILNDEEIEEMTSEYRRPDPSSLRGQIPNQKLIAEAKKRREEARKAREEDYIALDDTERFVDSKSRLIREDDNDLSDEDAEIVMSSTSGQLSTSREKEADIRRRNREMLERDEMIGSVLEGSDEETQRWEEAQLRKGVTLPQIQALSEEISKPVRSPSDYMTPQYAAMWTDQSQQSAVATIDEIRKKIRNRMEIARDSQRRHTNELEKVSGDIRDCKEAISKLDLELKSASFEYKFYQEMRGFVWDVIDCYNDKVNIIAAIEDKTVAVLRRGSAAARELRQQYIKDLSEEIHGKNSLDILPNLKEASERRFRLSEYNERRKRMAASAKLSEESFDIDEYESPSASQPPAYVEALASSASVFEDTVDDFRSLPVLLGRFQEWKKSCSHSYDDAYIAHCVPKLITPLIRYHLLVWNPLKAPVSIVDMPWVKEVLANIFVPSVDGQILADDADLRILPMLIEDVVFPKLTTLLDIWDPMSTIQCSRLSGFIRETFVDFPLVALNRKPVQDFFRALTERLTKAIEDDVFIPVYSQRVLDSDPEARLFIGKQFASGLKLFSNILLFHGILSNAALVELSIERLLNRCLLIPLRTSHNRSESIARCKAILARIPEDRLTKEPSPVVPKHFEMFCHVILNLGKQNPNRNEVSELSGMLSQLKDFKGAETLERQLHV